VISMDATERDAVRRLGYVTRRPVHVPAGKLPASRLHAGDRFLVVPSADGTVTLCRYRADAGAVTAEVVTAERSYAVPNRYVVSASVPGVSERQVFLMSPGQTVWVV